MQYKKGQRKEGGIQEEIKGGRKRRRELRKKGKNGGMEAGREGERK